jgi:hypothetical protein
VGEGARFITPYTLVYPNNKKNKKNKNNNNNNNNNKVKSKPLELYELACKNTKKLRGPPPTVMSKNSCLVYTSKIPLPGHPLNKVSINHQRHNGSIHC